MKREIKFKRYFQHEETGAISTMIWGCVNYKYESVSDFSGFVSPGNNNKAYPIADCQFTGLKDKNGVEIWENDIVKHNGINFTAKNNRYLLIEFIDGAFCLTAKGMVEFTDRSCDIREMMFQAKRNGIVLELEVIGNISENPELLQS